MGSRPAWSGLTPRRTLKIVFSSAFYLDMQAESCVVDLIPSSLARNTLAHKNGGKSPAKSGSGAKVKYSIL